MTNTKFCNLGFHEDLMRVGPIPTSVDINKVVKSGPFGNFLPREDQPPCFYSYDYNNGDIYIITDLKLKKKMDWADTPSDSLKELLKDKNVNKKEVNFTGLMYNLRELLPETEFIFHKF